MERSGRTKVVDLCSGLGGASKPFRDRGHQVFSVDIDPIFESDLLADVRRLEKNDFPFEPDFIWASPPCTEFTKWNMPWYPNKTPDISLVKHCIYLIRELKPRYWTLENVRGSLPFITPLLGEPTKRISYYYLWGNFPLFDTRVKKRSQKTSSTKPGARSKIPYELSKTLCVALEHALGDKLK